jgi:hypothetical protein
MVLALGSGWALVKVGLLLSALLGALVLANRRLRDRMAASGPTAVRLTAQHSVHVVELEGKRLLVGVGPSGAPRLLCELERTADRAGPHHPEPPASTPREGPRVGWDGP